MMKKYFNLIPLLMIFIFCIQAMASQTKETVKVSINGNESSIRVLNHDYDKNMYISMNDMSDLLKDTDKAFIVEWTSKDGQTCVVLKPGKSEDETDTDKKEYNHTPGYNLYIRYFSLPAYKIIHAPQQ